MHNARKSLKPKMQRQFYSKSLIICRITLNANSLQENCWNSLNNNPFPMYFNLMIVIYKMYSEKTRQHFSYSRILIVKPIPNILKCWSKFGRKTIPFYIQSVMSKRIFSRNLLSLLVWKKRIYPSVWYSNSKWGEKREVAWKNTEQRDK